MDAGARGTGSRAGTLAGLVAIASWSTVVAFARSLAENLGTFTAGSAAFLLGGVAAFAALALRRAGGRGAARFGSARYVAACGALFVAYEVLLYAAIGLAADGQQVLEVGLLNYLWIGFTLLFAVPVLGKRARWPLPVGLAVALAGIALVQLRGDSSPAILAERLAARPLPYACALGAAVAWGLYSNLTRRLAAEAGAAAVPLFIAATGLVLLACRGLVAETPAWSPRALLELAYMALVPNALGYVLWDVAMRRGNVVLVASAAYAIPVVSTLFSARYLDVPAGGALWLGCALVTAGAVLCRRGVEG